MQLQAVTNFFIETIFPSACYGCKKPGTFLCAECYPGLDPLPHPICPHCSARAPFGVLEKICSENLGLERIFMCARYENELVNRLVKDTKYKSSFKLAEPLAEFAYWALKKEGYMEQIAENIDITIPVPMHIKKQKLRGYNHAEYLAKHFSELFSAPCMPDALKKIRKTSSQVEAGSLRERRSNLARSFVVPEPFLIKNKTVLLIDDVVTTGSTLKECAKTLRRAGAKEVWALVIATD